jgi:hypothetical protein
MGLKLENNPHLVPRVAMRKDEVVDDSARLTVQPDTVALEAYMVKKEHEKAEKIELETKIKAAEAQAKDAPIMVKKLNSNIKNNI